MTALITPFTAPPTLAFRLGSRSVPRLRALVLVVGGALLTARSAPSSTFSSPWTPVPVTGQQPLAVLLVAATLGMRLGVASQGLYVVLGAIGLPFYAGGEGGWTAASCSTAGYLVGFVIAAAVVGALAERGQDRSVLTASPPCCSVWPSSTPQGPRGWPTRWTSRRRRPSSSASRRSCSATPSRWRSSASASPRPAPRRRPPPLSHHAAMSGERSRTAHRSPLIARALDQAGRTRRPPTTRPSDTMTIHAVPSRDMPGRPVATMNAIGATANGTLSHPSQRGSSRLRSAIDPTHRGHAGAPPGDVRGEVEEQPHREQPLAGVRPLVHAARQVDRHRPLDAVAQHHRSGAGRERRRHHPGGDVVGGPLARPSPPPGRREQRRDDGDEAGDDADVVRRPLDLADGLGPERHAVLPHRALGVGEQRADDAGGTGDDAPPGPAAAAADGSLARPATRRVGGAIAATVGLVGVSVLDMWFLRFVAWGAVIDGVHGAPTEPSAGTAPPCEQGCARHPADPACWCARVWRT